MSCLAYRKKQLSENLLSADLHGALLIVAECKAASYQGVSGIMIRDTAETFGIISEDNRFREFLSDLLWDLQSYQKLVRFSSSKRTAGRSH
jgi:hypothetical protein